MDAVENLIQRVQDRVSPPDSLPRSELQPRDEAPISRLREPPEWVLAAERTSRLDGESDEVVLNGPSAIDDWSEAQPPMADPDVHAFYLPFHFYLRWGIYVRAGSVRQLAASMLRKPRLTGTPIEQLMARDVYRMLLEHETFHHFAISRFEDLALDYMDGDSIYARVFHQLGMHRIEEGMANAHALRVLEKRVVGRSYSNQHVMRGRIAAFMESQPAGYNEFQSYLSNSQFLDGQDNLITEARFGGNQQWTVGRVGGLIAGRHHFMEKQRPAVCPVHLVVEENVGVAVARPFPKANGMQVYVHTRNEHPPPHFHLDKPPGTPFGRFLRPSLEPYPGDPALSRKEAENLREYVLARQPEMLQKMRAVFSGVEPIA